MILLLIWGFMILFISDMLYENKNKNSKRNLRTVVSCKHISCAWNKIGFCSNQEIDLEDVDGMNLKCASFDFE